MRSDPLQVAIYEYYGGPLYLDGTFLVSDGEFTTDKYGFGYFKFKINLTLAQAAKLYKLGKNYHIFLGTATVTLFEGRLEDVALGNEIVLTAYGYWRSFTDLQVTDVWSLTDPTVLKPLPARYGRRGGNKGEDHYELRTDNFAAYLALKKNSTMSGYFGMFTYLIPDKSSRPISTAELNFFELKRSAGTGGIGLQRLNSDYYFVEDTFTPNPYARTAPTTPTSGHYNVISPILASGLGIYMFNSDINTLYVGETGDWSYTVSGVRLGCSPSISGGRLFADEILRYYASGVVTLNRTMLNPDVSSISSPSYDLKNIVFEDVTGLDVIETLLRYPSSTGDYWEFRIWENQKIYFGPKRIPKTWYLSVPDFNINRSLDTIYTQDRLIYGDRPIRSEPERTTFYSLQTPYAINRQSATKVDVPASQISQVQTAKIRDASGKERFGIEVSSIKRSDGIMFPSYLIRSGDRVILDNIPIYLEGIIDSSFIVASTVSDLTTGVTKIYPVNPAPELEAFLARVNL